MWRSMAPAAASTTPTRQFYENYACGSDRNYSGYCNPELDKEIDRQSMEPDQEKRKKSGLGDRPKIAGGRRPADHLPEHRRDLLAAARQRADDDGQQHLQRLAFRRCVARPVKARGVLAAAAWFLVAMPATEASAQKAGGILKVYNRDSPASMSILEEATLSTVLSMMGVFNNLVVYDQHVAQNSEQSIVPELATELVVERGRDAAHLQSARRGQMARRQAVHRQGREMHLGPADRQGKREVAHQPPQVLVQQPRRGRHRRRLSRRRSY